jgi:ankyrin repeat protein
MPQPGRPLGPRVAFAALFVGVVSGGVAAAADARLIDAVRGKDVAAVKALLSTRVDPNAPQGDGATALHWAVHLDDLTTADMLLRGGARAGVANDLGVTPLYLACNNRSSAMVDRLLAARADANATLLNGETVLMNCARTGNVRAVKALLTAGARVNATEPAHDQTALMWAAAERHPDVVGLLLEAGADLKVRSRVYTQTVTSEVTQRAGREELNYTVPRGGMTALLFAARSGDVGSARALIAAGADANDALPDGTPALTLAAHSGHGAVGSLLLEKGADPNGAGPGYTALHAAVLRKDAALVTALLARGADPNARMTKGTPMRRTSQDFDLPAALIPATPYVLAAKFLEPEIMRLLAAGGADTRAAMRDGATPLMLATGIVVAANLDRRGVSVLDGGTRETEALVFPTVEAALALGSDVNAVNEAGETALHMAAASGYDRVVRLLVENGARLDVKNRRGLTPLGVAAAMKAPAERVSTTELLRRLGAVE